MRPLSSKIFTRTPKSQFLFHVLVKMYQKWNNLIYLSLGTSKTQKKKKDLCHPLPTTVGEGTHWPGRWKKGLAPPRVSYHSWEEAKNGNSSEKHTQNGTCLAICYFPIRISKTMVLGPIQV